MARIASITESSYSPHSRSDLTLLGWLLMLTVLIAAALFVEEDNTSVEQTRGVQPASAAAVGSEACQGNDLRARMCKVATEGGLTAGIQY